MKSKVIVLRTAGTNCDKETGYAFKTAGAQTVDLVHINRLFKKEVKLSDYNIMAIPGGFSFGDDISAGKVFANKLIYQLSGELKKFVDSGKLIIGICNGFQVLVKTGLLDIDNEQSQTLSFNDSAKFECRWVNLKISNFKSQISNQQTTNIWTKNLPEIIQLPVAHAEGKFITRDESITDELEENGRIMFQYCDEEGDLADYPYNPNGAQENIAGICDKTGRVLGMMPHPERYIMKYQHAAWTAKELDETGSGFHIFKNAVDYIKNNL
ncbi:MAG: phosphoribosylformylglycinamidine synthase I [Elusimicrobia bacterium RIFOXYA2_FULL_39_19]|nr:MAG: phosphoribosylformylglycinamidine synthase I [Elusimicrobia bacterium RIFOXYA2_FULL_39_19]